MINRVVADRKRTASAAIIGFQDFYHWYLGLSGKSLAQVFNKLVGIFFSPNLLVITGCKPIVKTANRRDVN